MVTMHESNMSPDNPTQDIPISIMTALSRCILLFSRSYSAALQVQHTLHQSVYIHSMQFTDTTFTTLWTSTFTFFPTTSMCTQKMWKILITEKVYTLHTLFIYLRIPTYTSSNVCLHTIVLTIDNQFFNRLHRKQS